MNSTILRIAGCVGLALPVFVNQPAWSGEGSRDAAVITYGLSSLSFSNGPAAPVKIDHPLPAQQNFSLVKTAEAALPVAFTPAVYEKISVTIKDAGQIEDLKPVLSDRYFQSLKARATGSASRHIVLAMLQEMRPKRMLITDAQVTGNQADLALSGQSYLGAMQGTAHLVYADGIWKVDSENWYVGDRDKKDALTSVLKARPSGTAPVATTLSADILNNISPDYDVNNNFLELTPVPNDRRKRAFTFVFLMNSGKKDGAEAGEDKPDFRLIDKPRMRMHILVPHARRVLPEQKLIEREGPIDVSVAKDEDGYAPGEWNLVLPGKKPREVRVKFMWSF